MINLVIQWSLNHRVLVLLLTLAGIILGARALHLTPVDAIPDLSDVQVIIKTQYPGQAPSVVEKQVTYPMTSALMSVPGSRTVRGFSFYGDSYIYVIFEEGTDIYWARSRVLEYLNQITNQLPSNVTPQLGPDASGVGWVYMYALQDKTGQHDLAELREIQDWLLQHELQSLPGVAEIATIGGMIKQYQIVVDPQKLQFYGIPLQHLRTAIQTSNTETGLSVIELAEAEYMLHATGYISNAQHLLDVPLGIRHQGVPLRLEHIAQVVETPAMRRGVAELNGEGEVAGGIVVMRHGANAQTTINGVKARLKQLQKALPKGVEIVPVYDRSQLIQRAVRNLWNKVIQELVIVGLLMCIFLMNVRSALVALISLPTGILLSFIIMYSQGINANIMSLGGIAIAIGAMVDGAIVMVENLHRKHAQNPHENQLRIVQDSCKEVGPTLFFSLLIITISFMPVFALEAEEGRLFQPLAYTKTYAMAAAALLSVTLMPVLLYYFVRPPHPKSHSPKPTRPWQLQSIYQKILIQCLNHKGKTLLISAGIALFAWIPLHDLPREFMPPLDEGDLMYMPTTHPGISIGKARELLQQTDKIILTIPEVKTVFGKVGRADTATDPAPLTMIETFIQLRPKHEWRPGTTTQDIIDELESKIQFPGLTNAWVMPIKTRIDMLSTGMKTPLGIKLAGPDSSTLQKLGEQLESLLSQLPQTQSVYAERTAGGRYLTLDIDRRAAATHDLSVSQLQQWLQMAVAGSPISEAIEDEKRFPISIRFPDAYRNTPEALMDLPIITPSGTHIRLGDVAELTLETGPPVLKSENARLNAWLYIDVGHADIHQYVKRAEQAIAQSFDWPSGYTLRWSGRHQDMERVQKKLLFIIPLTLCAIAIILYLCFHRLTDVVLLMCSLPFALTGGLTLVALLQFKLSVAVIVGFIALAGLAVETGAIMLQVLRSNVRYDHGDDGQRLHQQISHYASQRIKPVLMTATSTIAALLPVMYGQEPGVEVMSRIAAPIIGGLTTSVLLTLLVIPVLFSLFIFSKPKGP